MHTSDTFDVAALRRREFPWADARTRVYLNSASTGPLPERSRLALDEYIARACSPDHRVHRDVLEIPAAARRVCAELIGAHEDEIALGFNTTFGINLAATALPLAAGDRVLLMDGDFPANIYPWLHLQRRGINVELVPRDARGLPDEAAALERIARGGIRVFATSHVNFCTGFRFDLDAISHECRKQGTYLFVDAIQAVGLVPLDVSRTRIDILACGAQKWLLSPHGSAFAYVRRELVDELEPLAVGWLGFKATQNFSDILDYSLDPLETAQRFELGSLIFPSLHACRESLGLLLELGIERIERHVHGVQQTLIDWVDSRSELEWASDLAPGRRSGILAFRAREPERLARLLGDAGITLSLREGALRVSIHAFNCREEIERMIEVLEPALSR
jgi:selenocysteine lyase/cysteine desulfurase